MKPGHLFVLAGTIFLAVSGCRGNRSRKEVAPPHAQPSGPKSFHGAMVGDRAPIPVPSKYANMKLRFPDTTCGHLVKRFYECEIERLSHATVKDATGTKAEALRRSMMTYKKIKFAQRLDLYLDHCRRVTKDIPPSEIEGCISKGCREMDACLTRLAQKHGLPTLPSQKR